MVTTILIATLGPGAAGAVTNAHTKTAKSGFAGYEAVSATVTSTSATVTLPSFTCKSKSDEVTTQLDAYDPNRYQLVSYVYITLGCSKVKHHRGFVTQFTPYLATPSVLTSPTMSLHAGDVITFSVTCGPAGNTLSIDDQTTSAIETASSSVPSSCSAVLVGDFAWPKGKLTSPKGTGAEPLPLLGSFNYTNVLINGSPLGSLSSAKYNYYEGKKNVITTGALTDGGRAFTASQGA